MKHCIYLLFLLFVTVVKGQNLPVETSIQNFKKCQSKECQIKNSFFTAEYYLEVDQLNLSQKWLDITKNLSNENKNDTTSIFVNSLQSELFYYNGLFQFGINEAEKVIKNSTQLKDSLLISNGFFFKGINLYELNNMEEAQKMLWKSRNFQPRNFHKKQLRAAIYKEHVYNNLAQIKLQLRESDSAIWYNSKAYEFAKKSNSKRAISNIEQTFSLIYIYQNKTDNAIEYLKKSIKSATKNNYDDIVLANYGYFLECYPADESERNHWFEKGLTLIKEKKVNVSYQVIFYKTVIKSFIKNNQLKQLAFAQEQLIKINQQISLSNNDYIQTIAKEYLKTENKLLKQELRLIKSTKEKQIFYALISALILITISLWYFSKQRQKLKNQEIDFLKQTQEIAKLEALIDGEEKERRRIAQELHDGLNGDLSAIKYRLSTLEEAGLNPIDAQNLTKVIDMIDDSCAQVRSISHNLMPSSILDYGLIETVKEYCLKIKTTNFFKIDFQSFGNYIALSKKSETVIYRIIQELISNILKHAQATEAMIQFNYRTDELFITVEDNGIGFDVNALSKGMGHENIKTRIDFLNAHLNVDSSSAGTSYTISIDLNKVK